MRKRVLRRAVMTAATLAFLVTSVAHAGTNIRPAQAVPGPAAVNSAPVVSVPADFDWEADTLGGWQSWFTATAIDAEDGPLAVTCTPAPGSLLPLGATTVSCSATDSAGAPGSASFVVTVVDTTAPLLTSVPALLWVETPDPAGAVVGWPEPWAVDIVDGLVTVTCLPASGSTFALGATPVTCSAADLSGNVATDSFMLYLTLVDSTPPVLSDVPADMVVDTTDPWGTTVTWPLPTAIDNIDGSLPVICAPASGSFFYGGSTVVTCTATDTRGNAGTASFTVTVNVAPLVDTTPPALGDVPTGIAVDTYDPSGAVVTWPDPWAVDDLDGPLPVNCTPASGSLFEVGTTIVECSATDSSGNDGTAPPFEVQVTLLDITPPVISAVPADMVVPAAGPGGTPVSWSTPSALDNIDGEVPVTCDPASGSHFAVGPTHVTCSASDAHGNS
ncbi:MAG: HYR domain-containing protein, partial [Chloroflexota bacterium]|nr:HYR domain-containing protein [Chloroflexota bacterium]